MNEPKKPVHTPSEIEQLMDEMVRAILPGARKKIVLLRDEHGEVIGRAIGWGGDDAKDSGP